MPWANRSATHMGETTDLNAAAHAQIAATKAARNYAIAAR